MSFSKYLRLYKDSWLKLQKTSPELGSYEDRTLYSTWQLSFDQVQQRNMGAAELLRLWAYFDNQDLWLELLQEHGPDDPTWIREVAKDELSFDNTIRVLSDYGLVEVSRSLFGETLSGTYSIHSCVHSWSIHVLNQELDQGLARLAIKCAASHVPETSSTMWWLTQRRLLPHATQCSHFVLKNKVIFDGLEWALHCFGDLYSDQDRLQEAEAMYQWALQGKEKALGPDHTSTLDIVHNLGLLYSNQGKLQEAEVLYQRALQGCEKALGPDHTSTLTTVNNLGLLYSDQGKLQ